MIYRSVHVTLAMKTTGYLVGAVGTCHHKFMLYTFEPVSNNNVIRYIDTIRGYPVRR